MRLDCCREVQVSHGLSMDFADHSFLRSYNSVVSLPGLGRGRGREHDFIHGGPMVNGEDGSWVAG